jgi:hypothetical protein
VASGEQTHLVVDDEGLLSRDWLQCAQEAVNNENKSDPKNERYMIFRVTFRMRCRWLRTDQRWVFHGVLKAAP